MKAAQYIQNIKEMRSGGDTEQMLALNEKLAQEYPYVATAQNFSGNIYFEAEQFNQAAICYANVLKTKPHHKEAREHLTYALYLAEDIEFTDQLRKSFLKILKKPDGLNIDLIVKLWANFMVEDPANEHFDLCMSMGYPEFKKWLESQSFEQRKDVLSDALIAGMTLNVVPNIKIETFLTYCRRFLLEFVCATLGDSVIRASISRYEKLATAMARCCYNSDYLFPESEEEQTLLQKLLDTDPRNLESLDIAVIASYTPLNQHKDIVKVTNKIGFRIFHAGGLKTVIQQQIKEPQSRAALASKIKKLAPIDNQTSQNVRAQYEQNPYPRWHILKNTYYHDIETRIADLDTDNKNILVAGCATGSYSLNIARAYPSAHITGIDLSLASLCYAQYKAESHKIRNVDFYQGDILNAQNLSTDFDTIHTVGVLHHMKKPEEGLHALLSVLKKGGYIKIGLYSKTARRHIIDCQKDLKEKGLEPTVEGIRAARAYILSFPEDHPYRIMENYTDFYNVSMLRDMLFHVQEHCFDIADLQKLINDAELEFLGFDGTNLGDAKDQYAAEYRDDPDMTNLENWKKFEAENPDTFIAMYNFWCRK